ncbi:MAG TPA: tetratricopeptide repeat protein, partial [Smithella sp.]|nr:tetratricopeptide repeat protein [Smithella sp.]
NYIGLGFAYDQLGQHQQAITEYSKAIALKPDNARAYNNRGADYLSLGNHQYGCLDAKKACELGNCKLHKIAEKQGVCR